MPDPAPSPSSPDHALAARFELLLSLADLLRVTDRIVNAMEAVPCGFLEMSLADDLRRAARSAEAVAIHSKPA